MSDVFELFLLEYFKACQLIAFSWFKHPTPADCSQSMACVQNNSAIVMAALEIPPLQWPNRLRLPFQAFPTVAPAVQATSRCHPLTWHLLLEELQSFVVFFSVLSSSCSISASLEIQNSKDVTGKHWSTNISRMVFFLLHAFHGLQKKLEMLLTTSTPANLDCKKSSFNNSFKEAELFHRDSTWLLA